MRKPYNINLKTFTKGLYPKAHKTRFKKIPRFSMLLVLMVGVLSLAVNKTTFAEETKEVQNDTASRSSDAASDDNQIARIGDSGVTVSFSPTSGSANITPTTADGALAKINIKANIHIASTGGYAIHLSGANANLTGERTGATIEATSTAATFNNLKVNTWGYAVVEGESVPDTATYTALPQGQGITLKSATGNQTNVNHNYALSFATRIGNNKPADTYSNQITLSVTSSPLQIASLSTIANMQDMTSQICHDSEVGETKQLVDLRDGRRYWVEKMPDSKCWMTQNLDLDLGASWPDASLSDYNSANTTYKPVATATIASSSTIDPANTATRSWSLGDYVITNPTTASLCGATKSGFINCPSQYTNVSGKMASTDPDFYKNNGNKTIVGNEYDAHYLTGNHYQWNTATAGTGGTMTNGQATGSICPKNWRLPTMTGTNEFKGLIDAGSIGTNTAKLAGDGYFFVRGGDINQNVGLLLENAGSAGFYWSSSPNTSTTNSYSLYFHDANGIEPSIYFNRSSGFSVRCVAR